MNKNIKKVIAIALAVSAFGAIKPVTDFNLLTTRVYAANSEKYLDSLTVSTSDGDDIKLYGSGEYKNNERISDAIKITLNDGDIYIMSEKAVGFDWKKSSIPTLRHATGCAKFVA